MTKKRKHPTLSEVAAKAGVGTTTVSRVINGGQLVDPKTLARVRKAIEALGYMPNQAARSLKGRRSRTVGLIVPSIADPFFSTCAEAAQAVARANGSLLIVTTTQNDPRTELESVDGLTIHRADGLIIAPSNSDTPGLRDALVRTGMPVVTIDRPLAGSPFPSVVANNFVGAQEATQHLIEHGYKRIACITGEANLYTIRERIGGYQQAMEAAGHPVMLDTSITDYSSAERAVERMLAGRRKPDAILTLKNSTTIYVFEALQRLGFPIPDAVALLGYDDFELADTVRPSISVVRQPIADIGRSAAELLFQELLHQSQDGRTQKHGSPRQIQLGTCLVRRNSCGCSPNGS